MGRIADRAVPVGFMVVTMIVAVIMFGLTFHYCSHYRRVALDWHDYNSWLLTLICSLEILVTSIVFALIVLMKKISKSAMCFAVVWHLLFHIGFHVYVLYHIEQTANPTTSEIINAYDAEVRASGNASELPPWLNYVYDSKKCCGFYDPESGGPVFAEEGAYLRSMDQTLRSFTCTEESGEKNEPEIYRNLETPLRNIFRFRPRNIDLTKFHLDYEKAAQDDDPDPPTIRELSRKSKGKSLKEVQAKGRDEDGDYDEDNSGENEHADDGERVFGKEKGCAEVIQNLYDFCLTRLFHYAIVTFCVGFIPLAFFFVAVRTDRRRKKRERLLMAQPPSPPRSRSGQEGQRLSHQGTTNNGKSDSDEHRGSLNEGESEGPIPGHSNADRGDVNAN